MLHNLPTPPLPPRLSSCVQKPIKHTFITLNKCQLIFYKYIYKNWNKTYFTFHILIGVGNVKEKKYFSILYIQLVTFCHSLFVFEFLNLKIYSYTCVMDKNNVVLKVSESYDSRIKKKSQLK